jgi:hypothetical protein
MVLAKRYASFGQRGEALFQCMMCSGIVQQAYTFCTGALMAAATVMTVLLAVSIVNIYLIGVLNIQPVQSKQDDVQSITHNCLTKNNISFIYS